MSVPDLSEHLRTLETWLAKLRLSGAFLLDQDMWDRWGRNHASDHEIVERTAREREMTELRAVAMRELEALVASLRATAPEAIAAWADAHDELLAGFIERTGPVEPNSTASTAVFVATEERDGWQAVKRGEQPFVDGNTFYISIDRDHYRRLFGIEP